MARPLTLAHHLHRQDVMTRFAAFILIAGLVTSAGAQALDDASSKALADTLRSLEAGPGPGQPAPKLDPRLGSIAGSPEHMKELYAVASDVFQELAAKYGGDPDKMAEALERGRSDPEGFAAALSPATRARLRALADGAGSTAK